MIQTLFVVHVEEMFRGFFGKMYVNRLRSAVLSDRYNRVVYLNSGIDSPDRIEDLSDLPGEDMEWGWGYEPPMFEHDEEELKWCIPAPLSPHEWTWVPPELREITQGHLGAVTVAGGARGECLQDFIHVLRYLKIQHRVPEGFTYGA